MILIVGFLMGALVGFGIPDSKLHGDCKRGDKAACEVIAKNK